MVATMTVGTKVVTGGLKFAPSSRFKVVENDTAATNVDISVAIRTKI